MTEYERIIELSIREMAEMAGRRMAIARAQSVRGIEIDDDGNVVALERPGKEVMRDLVDVYADIGGELPVSLIADRIRSEVDLDEIDLPERLREELQTVF